MAWSESDQIECMGDTESNIVDSLNRCIDAKFDGVAIAARKRAFSIMSDCQELLEMSADKNRIRRLLNYAKFCLHFADDREAETLAKFLDSTGMTRRIEHYRETEREKRKA